MWQTGLVSLPTRPSLLLFVRFVRLRPAAAAAAEERGGASIEDPRRGAPDDLETSGIEEELAARMTRPRSRSASSGPGAGAHPGLTAAVEADRPLEGGAAGLIGAAPEMAKV